MKLLKYLCIAAPIALLASCGDGDQGGKTDPFKSTDSSEIAAKAKIDAAKVIEYTLTNSETVLGELTTTTAKEKWVEKTNDKDNVRVFVKTDSDKLYVKTYSKDQLSKIEAKNFNAFTKLEKAEVISSSSKNILGTGGTVTSELFKSHAALKTCSFDQVDFLDTTSLAGMFKDVRTLTSVIFTGCKFGKVTDLSSMFEGATDLATTAVSGLDTSKVEKFDNMFKGATKVATVDLSAYDFSSAKSVAGMFDGTGKSGTTGVKPKKETLTFTDTKATNENKAEWEKEGSLVKLNDQYVMATKADGTQFPVNANNLFANPVDGQKFIDELKRAYVSDFDSTLINKLAKITATDVKHVVLSADDADFNTGYTEPATASKEGDAIRVFWNSAANTLGLLLDHADLSELSAKALDQYTNLESFKVKKTAAAHLFADAGVLKTDLFKANTKLTTVEILDLNLANTITLEGLFKDLASLTTVSFEGSILSSVKLVKSMFEGTAITTTEIPGLTTDFFTHVKDFSRMFANTTKLATANLSKYSFAKAKDVSSMFEGAGAEGVTGVRCKDIDFTEETAVAKDKTIWQVNKLIEENAKYVWGNLSEDNGANKYPVLATDLFKNAKQTLIDNLQKDASLDSQTILDVSGIQAENIEKYVVTRSLNDFDNKYKDGYEERNTSVVDKFRIKYSTTDKQLVLYAADQTATVANSLINKFTALTSLQLDGTLLTNEGTFTLTFASNTTITKVNLVGFDFQGTTTLANLFKGATGLTDVDFTDASFAKVTDLSNMFDGATGITTTVIKGLKTNTVEKFDGMFANIPNLATVDLSVFNFDSAKSMAGMFKNSGESASPTAIVNAKIASYEPVQATSEHNTKNPDVTETIDYVLIVDQTGRAEGIADFPVKATEIFEGANKIKTALTTKFN